MIIALIIPLIIGWIAGYLVNYLADVLPRTRRFSQPGCLQCEAPFTLKNYLALGACKNGHARNIRTWIVQIVITVLSVYTWINPSSKIGYFLGFILITYFGVVFVIDMEHRLILHPTSIFGSVLGLLIGWLKWGLLPTLLGGLGGLVIMLGFYYFGVLFTRIRSKRMQAKGQEIDDEEALGAGDVILVTIIGFLLGWPLIWFGLFFGILFGGMISVLIIIGLVVTRKYEANSLMLFIPYGPYFITSAFLILFFPKFVQLFVPGN
jgi:leader peptidase (prepilin peptidase)/N-methyltransferase